jgi:hypothetical protein
MPRTKRPADAGVRWTIQSVTVRARDGPQRLRQAYRILIGGCSPAQSREVHDEEVSDACSDLCQSVHRQARERTNRRQPARGAPPMGE